MKKILIALSFFCAGLVLQPGVSQAIPELQLYINGATFDMGTETWVTTAPHFQLWVLGDVDAKGTLYDVNLVAAFSSLESGSITFSPALSIAGSGVGTVPSKLSSHGIYGFGTSWNSYSLGNFTGTADPIGDYYGSVPSSFPDDGQINKYDVTVSGYSEVHFDAYGYYIKKNGQPQDVFAPYSHDAEATPVPEPGTMLLLGTGLLGLAVYGKRRMNRES
jgi:hypothetical protein